MLTFSYKGNELHGCKLCANCNSDLLLRAAPFLPSRKAADSEALRAGRPEPWSRCRADAGDHQLPQTPASLLWFQAEHCHSHPSRPTSQALCGCDPVITFSLMACEWTWCPSNLQTGQQTPLFIIFPSNGRAERWGWSSGFFCPWKVTASVPGQFQSWKDYGQNQELPISVSKSRELVPNKGTRLLSLPLSSGGHCQQSLCAMDTIQ